MLKDNEIRELRKDLARAQSERDEALARLQLIEEKRTKYLILIRELEDRIVRLKENNSRLYQRLRDLWAKKKWPEGRIKREQKKVAKDLAAD